MRRRARWLLLVLLLGCHFAQAQPAIPAAYSLRGQIVNTLTGQPLGNTLIHVARQDWKQATPEVEADSDGRFTLPPLPEGRYLLSVSRFDLGTVFYGEYPDGATISSIAIGPDTQPQQVFKITPPGEIRGTVRDEFGEPVEGAEVLTLFREQQDGRIVYFSGGLSQTDDRGMYRLNQIRAGRYLVCARLYNPRIAAADGTLEFSATAPRRFYPDACPPTGNAANVQAVVLAPGQRASIDLSLIPTTTLQVSGQVVGVPAKSNLSVQLIGVDNNQRLGAGRTGEVDQQEHTFRISGVSPGAYEVVAGAFVNESGTNIEYRASTRINIGSSVQTTNVALTLQPAAILQFQIRLNGSAKSDPRSLSVGLIRAGSAQSAANWMIQGSPPLRGL